MRKYKGTWQYHFITTDERGKIDIDSQGKFHLDEPDANGKFKGKDEDGTAFNNGEITKSGSLESISFDRPASQTIPQRHFRGMKVFEGRINGEFCMVLVGQRQKGPFPAFAPDNAEERGLLAQDEGVWIATKP